MAAFVSWSRPPFELFSPPEVSHRRLTAIGCEGRDPAVVGNDQSQGYRLLTSMMTWGQVFNRCINRACQYLVLLGFREWSLVGATAFRMACEIIGPRAAQEIRGDSPVISRNGLVPSSKPAIPDTVLANSAYHPRSWLNHCCAGSVRHRSHLQLCRLPTHPYRE